MAIADTPLVGDFQIVEVGLESPLLTNVINLHSASKNTLGLFPKGAFEDHARKKQILAAVAQNNKVAGYLLYRIAKRATKNRASIVHLTTDEEFRRRGVAAILVEELKRKTGHLLGISLLCRRDYNISHLWESCGFTVRDSKQGRSATGALLDFWWYDHKHDDLFSFAASRDEASQRMLAVIDANVFYDLHCQNRPHAEDSKVLLADWLQESIELCITEEMYSEIHRGSDETQKRQLRAFAQSYHQLKSDEADFRNAENKLKPLFKNLSFDRNVSDMRQVAHAIAGEAPFFVTRDGPMLDRADMILEEFGLKILHPADLINQFDVLRREAEYRPARLEGSRWSTRLITSEDVSTVVSLFKHHVRERVSQFEQHVRHWIAKSDEWASRMACDHEKHGTVYWVQSKTARNLIIPSLRHTDHPLAGTLLRHILHEASRAACGDSHRVISVTDTEISDETAAALTELGFVYDSGAWWKMCVRGMMSRADIVTEAKNAAIPLSLKERLVGANFALADSDEVTTITRLEHLFSPVKITPGILPCYIVSIRPSWAEHFFAMPKGGQMLMDLNEKLHLGIEGAYYCAASNTHVTAPARILWYVSGNGGKSVKACSHLEERVIGLPKELYARFRHLGVYQWKHVFATAHGNISETIMAFRFSRTERFTNPIPLHELEALDIAQPQNPRKITDEQFAILYKKGTQS